jgi:hypothetical protein
LLCVRPDLAAEQLLQGVEDKVLVPHVPGLTADLFGARHQPIDGTAISDTDSTWVLLPKHRACA